MIACRKSMASLLIIVVVLSMANRAWAGPATVAAREAAEAIVSKFGREAASEGVEKLAARLESLAVRWGDETLNVARKVGPRGLRAVESAGDQAPLVLKLLSREGDRALWLVEDAGRLGLVARYGDDAAEALLRHQSVAQPVIQQFDQVGAKALARLDGQNARRLAMLADDGELVRLGRTPELLDVVGRYGDRAMDFIWRNKGALAATAALTAFLADPEPFLDGTRQLVETVGEKVVAPATTAVAREIAMQVEWTTLFIAVAAIAAGFLLAHGYLKRRSLARS